LPPGPNRVPLLTYLILTKRIRMQGFIITDHYGTEHANFFREMSGWIAEGKVTIREEIIDDLEQAPRALIGLLAGDNFGKVVIRVAEH
jgi:NADPH-dependent curcumin reductase CurA